MGITVTHSFLFLVIIFFCSTESWDDNGAHLETTAYLWLESINLPGYHRETALRQCVYLCLWEIGEEGRKGEEKGEGESWDGWWWNRNSEAVFLWSDLDIILPRNRKGGSFCNEAYKNKG